MRSMVLAGTIVLLVACAGSTGARPSPASVTAYCADLTRLRDDLDAAEADAGRTGAPNAYAAAELRDAGPIYSDAATSQSGLAVRWTNVYSGRSYTCHHARIRLPRTC